MQTSSFFVITGATKGLGLALSRKLASLGHRIAGCGRSSNEIAKLQKEFGDKHSFSVVDVSKPNEVQRWATDTLSRFGPPDFLINNAAIINSPAPLWEIESDEFSQLVEVNIKAVGYLIRAFVPCMVERRQGIIINLSSGWGRSVSGNFAPYCASKWAMEGLSKALAEELPQSMAAIPLNPGIIDTEMLRQCMGSAAENYPDSTAWAEKAAAFILQLSPRDNGASLSVPGNWD